MENFNNKIQNLLMKHIVEYFLKYLLVGLILSLACSSLILFLFSIYLEYWYFPTIESFLFGIFLSSPFFSIFFYCIKYFTNL